TAPLVAASRHFFSRSFQALMFLPTFLIKQTSRARRGKRQTDKEIGLMKKALSLLILAAAAITTQAQQPLTYTQHGQLRTAINPAASLIRPEGEISVLGRRQWVGVDGAPTVFWGSGHMGFQSIGATAGINIRHESLAIEKLTEASAFFAQGIRISETEYVGLSLNAGIAYHNGRCSQLTPWTRPSGRTSWRRMRWLVSG